MLINPLDPDFRLGLPALILRLVHAGFEQFVVPSEVSERISRILKESPSLFGLVLTDSELLGAPEPALALLPTAVLLSEDMSAETVLAKIRQFQSRDRSLSIAVLACPEREVGGRRLDQSLSSLAPYLETTLDHLVVQRSEDQ